MAADELAQPGQPAGAAGAAGPQTGSHRARRRPRRVLIDSLGDLAFAAGDEARYREYLYSLVQRCSRLGVSLLMTHELPELFQLIRLSELGVSHVSDNVVVLQYLRHQPEVRRTLTVLKTRASLHQPQVREFTITPEGITLQAHDV